MKRSLLLVVAGLVALVVALASPGSAGAGGWAVTTLDPLPAVTPGEAVEIGFTIRQHGVTPIALTGVQLVVHPGDGGPAAVFPARGDATLGHYVAEVTVPAGTHRWEVVQGGFGPQDLGPLVVAAPSAPPVAGSTDGWPGPVRYGLLALTVASALVFLAAVVGRPRRRTASV